MTPVIIMSGGRGMRLAGLTKDRPKGLIEVGGMPMIETIMRGFAGQGFKRFWLCLGYRADMIQDYFGDGADLGVKINYIHETEPLGTGGALRLLPEFGVPYIVSNCDVLVEPVISYGHLMEAHARSGAKATVCLALHQQQIGFGVADMVDGYLVGIREKPIENFMVNAGIYVLEPDAVDMAPAGRFDMPELLDQFGALGHFAIQGQWLDIGSFEDLARANGSWGQ